MRENETQALTKVIASLHHGYIQVIVGYDDGHVNHGVQKDISIAMQLFFFYI